MTGRNLLPFLELFGVLSLTAFIFYYIGKRIERARMTEAKGKHKAEEIVEGIHDWLDSVPEEESPTMTKLEISSNYGKDHLEYLPIVPKATQFFVTKPGPVWPVDYVSAYPDISEMPFEPPEVHPVDKAAHYLTQLRFERIMANV